MHQKLTGMVSNSHEYVSRGHIYIDFLLGIEEKKNTDSILNGTIFKKNNNKYFAVQSTAVPMIKSSIK